MDWLLVVYFVGILEILMITLMSAVGRFALFYTYRIINYHVESIQDNCICLPHKFQDENPDD